MNIKYLPVRTALLLLSVCGSVNGARTDWHDSGKGGAVAAGGKDAVAAGIAMLSQGGNAADAAVATLFALSITDHGMFAIGAEIPFIIYDAKTKKVAVLCGLGAAPLDKKAIEWFYKNGIPSEGGIKAAPVPAAVSLCIAALKLYGTMTLEQVLQLSLDLLDAGKALSPRDNSNDWFGALAKTFRKLVETEKNTKGTREQKLSGSLPIIERTQ